MWNQGLKQWRIESFSNLSQRNPSFLSFLFSLGALTSQDRCSVMLNMLWPLKYWRAFRHLVCSLSVPRRPWTRVTCFHRMKAATSSHQLYRRPTSTPPHITRLLWANTTSPPWTHPAATCTADARTHSSCFLRADHGYAPSSVHADALENAWIHRKAERIIYNDAGKWCSDKMGPCSLLVAFPFLNVITGSADHMRRNNYRLTLTKHAYFLQCRRARGILGSSSNWIVTYYFMCRRLCVVFIIKKRQAELALSRKAWRLPDSCDVSQ